MSDHNPPPLNFPKVNKTERIVVSIYSFKLVRLHFNGE